MRAILHLLFQKNVITIEELNLKVLSGLSAPLLFEVINAGEELEKEEIIQEVIQEARENCKDVLKSLLNKN
jgi:mannose/fructose-specific phosphotransferase system component IIA